MSGILFDRARSSSAPRWATVGELVREAAERAGEREFLRFPGTSLTFADVHQATRPPAGWPAARVRKSMLLEPGRDQRRGVFDAAANTWI